MLLWLVFNLNTSLPSHICPLGLGTENHEMPLAGRKGSEAVYDRPCEKASGCVGLASIQNERGKERNLGEWHMSLLTPVLEHLHVGVLRCSNTGEAGSLCLRLR